MRCPHCGSTMCHVITETDYKGFGFIRGCLGWLIFGPIGILCGMCGMGKGRQRSYWVCDSCRHRFRA